MIVESQQARTRRRCEQVHGDHPIPVSGTNIGHSRSVDAGGRDQRGGRGPPAARGGATRARRPPSRGRRAHPRAPRGQATRSTTRGRLRLRTAAAIAAPSRTPPVTMTLPTQRVTRLAVLDHRVVERPVMLGRHTTRPPARHGRRLGSAGVVVAPLAKMSVSLMSARSGCPPRTASPRRHTAGAPRADVVLGDQRTVRPFAGARRHRSYPDTDSRQGAGARASRRAACSSRRSAVRRRTRRRPDGATMRGGSRPVGAPRIAASPRRSPARDGRRGAALATTAPPAPTVTAPPAAGHRHSRRAWAPGSPSPARWAASAALGVNRSTPTTGGDPRGWGSHTSAPSRASRRRRTASESVMPRP